MSHLILSCLCLQLTQHHQGRRGAQRCPGQVSDLSKSWGFFTEAGNMFGLWLLAHGIFSISTVRLKLVCVWGWTHQANTLSWSQNILLLPLVLGMKGWRRCKGQLDTFHFLVSSWICAKLSSVTYKHIYLWCISYTSVSFSWGGI